MLSGINPGIVHEYNLGWNGSPFSCYPFTLHSHTQPNKSEQKLETLNILREAVRPAYNSATYQKKGQVFQASFFLPNIFEKKEQVLKEDPRVPRIIIFIYTAPPDRAQQKHNWS